MDHGTYCNIRIQVEDVIGWLEYHRPPVNAFNWEMLREMPQALTALIEDDSVRSQETVMLNAQVGYHFNARWTLSVEVFNLLNRKDSDIDYLYSSRLRGETIDVNDPRYNAGDGGYNDVHYHPVEPLAARVALTARF